MTSWFAGSSKDAVLPSQPSASLPDSQIQTGQHDSLIEPQQNLASSIAQAHPSEAELQAFAATSSHLLAPEGSNTIRKGNGPLSLSRPSGIRVGQQNGRASQQSVRAGQRSLKAFFQPPATKASGAALGAASTGPAPLIFPVVAASASTSTSEIAQPSFVNKFTSQSAMQQTSPLRSQTCLARTVHDSNAPSQQAEVQTASSCQDAAASSQSSQAISLSQSVPDAEKAAATEAWQRIHSKMKAPKCKGHSEDCVIREVKKSGPNKGEQGKRQHCDINCLMGSVIIVWVFFDSAVLDTQGTADHCCIHGTLISRDVTCNAPGSCGVCS